MIEKEFKSSSFKDMHPVQMEALMRLIHASINLASMCGDTDILEEVTAEADELVKLFGGNGVRLTIDVDA